MAKVGWGNEMDVYGDRKKILIKGKLTEIQFILRSLSIHTSLVILNYHKKDSLISFESARNVG